MLTIVIHAEIKEHRLNDYLEMVRYLKQSTSRVGCHYYLFNQSIENPTHFVIYEQWQDQAALDAHMQELFALLGPAKPGEPIPEKLMAFYQSARPVYCNVI